MKTVKRILLFILLLSVLIVIGCQEQQSSERRKVRIYSQRADALRIPTYSYRE